jgi:hypothetical protein
MPTASARRSERDGIPRRSRSGAHAGRPRRRWRLPVAILTAFVIAAVVLQSLGLLVRGGGESETVATEPVGVRTRVSVGDTGVLHVVQTLVFAQPQSRLRLSLPQRGGVAAELRPRLTSIVVRVPAPVTAVAPMEVGDQASVELTDPVTRFVLEYDAAGVVAGDGNALMTPLSVVPGPSQPSTVELDSGLVREVSCLRGTELTRCGTRQPDGWTVESSGQPGSRMDVLARLDLPAS